MTAVDEWHVSDHELERYVNHTIPTFARASVESHVLDCERCRSTLAQRVPNRAAIDVDPVWQRVADRIDVSGRPLRSSTTAIQVSTVSPLLLLATLGVALGVLVSVGLAAAFAPRASLPLFIMLAPMAPVVGAVLAFQPGIDPAGRLAGATPLAAARLPFFRAVFASGTALVSVVVASLFVSVGLNDAAVWLLPGLTLTTTVAAVSTWIDPRRVALTLGCLWAIAVATWSWGARPRAIPLDVADFAVERVGVQAALLTLTIGSVLVTVVRRNELPAWRVR